MPKAERLPVVKALREEGHSLRAIAGAVGVAESQVRKDLAGAHQCAPETVTGLDGKSYPARKEPKPPEVGTLSPPDTTTGRDLAGVTPVTPAVSRGRDGKSYPARKEGHSLRAIAGVVGVPLPTVQRDLSGVQPRTPEAVTGLDGKSYPAR